MTRIVDGPWPARNGLDCIVLTPPAGPLIYPWHGKGPNEVVVFIAGDPLTHREQLDQADRPWTCVLDKRHLEAS